MATNVPDYIARMDWHLLREQKSHLANLQADLLAKAGTDANVYIDTIEGVLNLLDAVQDYAEDELHIDGVSGSGDSEKVTR